MRLVNRIWILVACLLLLVACGGGDADPNPDSGADSTPPPASPTAEPEPELTMENVVWTEAVEEDTGAPVQIVENFTTQSPAIIAAVEVTNVPEGTTFTATWTINDQPIEGSEMQIESDGDLPHAWVAFSFTRDDDKHYPIGQLSVIITSSDGAMQESSIEIDFP